eukprot:Hpha_TRINITY_DN31229_c0_g1::TRINITY_DN31229_c0_g1_i1::g.2441::m.2441
MSRAGRKFLRFDVHLPRRRNPQRRAPEELPDFADVRRAAFAPEHYNTFDVGEQRWTDGPVQEPVQEVQEEGLLNLFSASSPVPMQAASEVTAVPGTPFSFSLDLVLDEPMTRGDIVHALTSVRQPQHRRQHFVTELPVPPSHWGVVPDRTFFPESTSGQKVKSFALRSPRMRWGPEAAGWIMEVFELMRFSQLGARVDPSGSLSADLSTGDLSTAEIAALCENWYRFEPALESLVCLDAQWAPWAGPPV